MTATSLRTADGSLWLTGSFLRVTRSGVVLGGGARADGLGVSAVWTRRQGVVPLFTSEPWGAYQAVRINSRGAISGYRSPGGKGSETAMLWGPEGRHPRQVGGPGTKAGQINDHGQVLVGLTPAGDPDTVTGRLFLHGAGRESEIVLPVPVGSYPQALALTESGHVIGNTAQYNPPPIGSDLAPAGGYQQPVPFHWYRGRVTDLTRILGGGRFPLLRAVNNSGLVVGYDSAPFGSQVFCWQDGEVSYLASGQYPVMTMITGGEQSLNDRGDIVGSCQRTWADAREPFLYTGGRLKVLPGLGGYAGQAQAVSSSGDLVAGSCMTPDGVLHACLWRDGQLIDLGVPDGFTESEGEWITDRGEVFGYALAAPGQARYLFRWTVS